MLHTLLLKKRLAVFSMDFDEEEEAPPLLVNVETQDGSPEEEPNIRVPITIVTGESYVVLSLDFHSNWP